ncbi:hypothetical protein SAMN02787073_5065 [Chryseobacterium vrystaatense]|uniref:Uncharacterized protein n=1 Tax=Chryseobacterium vrystaatense TaxID=307480 RepID=A0A1M5NSF4_9FLAO|nr:hypothetical protein SAMN02787073_5065 [Chryseobacterium vrystaatense]
MKTGIIVIDPEHSGMGNVGGSDDNHAVSIPGNHEKNLIRTGFLKCNILIFNFLCPK